MKHPVVSSSLLVIRPNPYSANAFSTAIRSTLSLYSVFLSVLAFFFGLPRAARTSAPAFPAISKVVPVLIDFICQNELRIMVCSFKVPFGDRNENIAFVISIKLHLFYPGHSFFIETQIHLCFEIHQNGCHTTDNQLAVRLVDTNDPVRNGVYFVFVHVLLLFINFVNHGKPFSLLWCQFTFCV